jgi:hypothetical protein
MRKNTDAAPSAAEVEEMFRRLVRAGDGGLHYRFLPKADKKKVDALHRAGRAEFDRRRKVYARPLKSGNIVTTSGELDLDTFTVGPIRRKKEIECAAVVVMLALALAQVFLCCDWHVHPN